MKLIIRHRKEQEAIEWAKAAYGRSWRKRFAVDLATEERTFPYPYLRHVCARPFGRLDWNLHAQWLRRVMNRSRMRA